VALRGLSRRFDAMYAKRGRPSIAPEKLLRALLLQMLYSIRSERMLMEQLDYNLLFRWFVGLNMDDRVWDASTFSQNRERLLRSDVAQAFFEQVRRQAEAAGLMSDEHFSVDGTLIEAWAGQKSLRRVDGETSNRRLAGGTRRSTSTARSAATTRTFRAPIRRRCWPARRGGARPSWPTAGTC
jgi:transposase